MLILKKLQKKTIMTKLYFDPACVCSYEDERVRQSAATDRSQEASERPPGLHPRQEHPHAEETDDRAVDHSTYHDGGLQDPWHEPGTVRKEGKVGCVST